MNDESRFAALETMLGRLMLLGVLSSAICLFAGLLIFLAGRAGPGSTGVLAVGLFLLMATPVLRVAVAVIEAIRMRDWFFVATTVTVAVLLAVTVTLAIRRI